MRVAVPASPADEEMRYEERDPTPEEIAAKEREWKEKNPYKFGAYMPDFSKQKVTVAVPVKRVESAAKARQWEARVAELEKALEEKATPFATRASVPAAATPAAPQAAKPHPAGVVMRKQADGRVVAIIGGKPMTFASEAEARAYLARLKP